MAGVVLSTVLFTDVKENSSPSLVSLVHSTVLFTDVKESTSPSLVSLVHSTVLFTDVTESTSPSLVSLVHSTVLFTDVKGATSTWLVSLVPSAVLSTDLYAVTSSSHDGSHSSKLRSMRIVTFPLGVGILLGTAASHRRDENCYVSPRYRHSLGNNCFPQEPSSLRKRNWLHYFDLYIIRAACCQHVPDVPAQCRWTSGSFRHGFWAVCLFPVCLDF